jgi:protein involved in polysaccharide export with SLBB domain
MQMIKNLGRCLLGAVVLLAGVLLLGGCASDYKYDPLAEVAQSTVGSKPANPVPPTKDDVLRVNDKVTVSFQDIPNSVLPITQTVKDDGTITLIYNQSFQVVGKTISEVEKEIHDRYVPAYFVNMTATVTTEERFYYVGGEVRSPNRQVYSGRIFLTGAIDTAGGFTDFANKRKIRLTRANGKTSTYNYKKALEDQKDNPEIFPGDHVYVPKNWL